MNEIVALHCSDPNTYFLSIDHCQRLGSKVQLHNFCPITYYLPYKVRPRAGFESGVVNNLEDFRLYMKVCKCVEIENPDPLFRIGLKIASFQGIYRFLSNFWPISIEYEGLIYPSTEAAFQAAKTTDLEFRKGFTTMRAGQAKRAGYKLQLRPDWETIKIDIMRLLLTIKFSDLTLKQQLLDTENKELHEGNTWHDNFWGECACEKCKEIEKHNMLGKLLMEVRDNNKD
jgi:ribA/ribD-fused uncharacterized protein